MTSYSLVIADPLGVRLHTIMQFETLEWVRVVNDKGYIDVTLPLSVFPRTYFGVDYQLQIWRKVEGFPAKRAMTGMMQYLRRYSDMGQNMIQIKGPGLNDILDTRIVAADSGSTGANKSGFADNVMKAYVREALGSLADATRTRSSILSVDADTSSGPSVTEENSRGRLLGVLQDIADKSYQKGTPVYFEVTPSQGQGMAFQTFIKQRGVDRSATAYLSESRGNLANASLEQDWRDEITFIYAAGQGTGAGRSVVPLEDATRSNVSTWRRREGLFDGRNYTSGLSDAGYKALRQGRPKRVFRGDIVNLDDFQYGVHWGFGDRVTAIYDSEQYVCEISSITGRVTRDGEDLQAGLRYVA